MTVKAVWEFEADVEDFDPEYVSVEGLAKDNAKRELEYLLKNQNLSADDFSYEAMNNGDQIYTLFVLDFDGTYNLESEDDLGVPPSVYFVPENKIPEVQKCAYDAWQQFVDDSELCSNCIGDYFEEFMTKCGIAFTFIGSIDIPFKKRQADYLADYIPREIV